jgi:hypothetical protein
MMYDKLLYYYFHNIFIIFYILFFPRYRKNDKHWFEIFFFSNEGFSHEFCFLSRIICLRLQVLHATFMYGGKKFGV